MSRDPINKLTLLFIVPLFFISWSLTGQPSVEEWSSFSQAHLHHQRSAMIALGGWAIGNIGLGLSLRSSREGSDRYFHDMNVYWNLVNLGIAGLGYWSTMGEDPASWSAFEAASKHHSFQKILLFNAGLDVGYVMAGLYLRERSRRAGVNADQLRGFGKSIILQGGFLFAFDLINYFIANRRAPQLKMLMGEDGVSGIGLSFLF